MFYCFIQYHTKLQSQLIILLNTSSIYLISLSFLESKCLFNFLVKTNNMQTCINEATSILISHINVTECITKMALDINR